ncbi:MAG: beta-propeller domain-containing protein [Ruminiclostridium sp.]|nr:beta-propeller domain-containing protein [Ruminiclostridium sp.]
MELLDKKIKEYIASISVPDEIKPSKIKQFIEDSGEITAGKFLKKLREMKISGSEFLELLGNSRIGNIAYRRIEENPHLRFDELLQILDSSELTHEDYSAMLNVAISRRKQSDDRKKREEETLRRVSLEEKGVVIPPSVTEEKPAPTPISEAQDDMTDSPVAVITEVKEEIMEEPAEEIASAEAVEEDMTAEYSAPEPEIVSMPEPEAEEETESEVVSVPEAYEETESEPENIKEDETEEIAEETPAYDYSDTTAYAENEISAKSDTPAEKTEAERTAAAEALIARIQASIDISEEEEKTESDTTAYENKEEQSYSENSEAVAEDYEEPIEKPYEENAAAEESEDDGFEDDTEEVGSSAKEIGDVISDLLDNKEDSEEEDSDSDEEEYDDVEEEEEPVTRKSKGYLIAAFICAFIVIGCAGALKLLRHYDIIPNYIFKIPEIVRQDIVDFPSLLEEVKKAEHTIGYTLPESFITSGRNNFAASQNAVGEKVCLAVTKKETEYYITGAALDNGKVGQSFSFAAGMGDVSVEYSNGYFIVVGNTDNMTEVRFYKEDNIKEGKADFSYRQSGKYAGYHTDDNAFYLVTENYFNLLDARSERLTSFIPSFEINDTLSVVPFDRISMPEYAARTNYCTVSRLPFDMGQTKIRSVLLGDAGGYHVSDKGLFTCDNTYLNEEYRSRITTITFDEELTAKHADIDGAVNPAMLMSSGDKLLAVGIAKAEKENANAVFRFDFTLSEAPAILSPIAKGETFEKAICGDEVLTLITAGEKPMQYNINIADLSAAEKGASAKSNIKIKDELYASVSVAFDSEGKRTGIVLTVGGKEKNTSITANVKNNTVTEWDAYLDSPFIEDISGLPFYDDGNGIIVGLPVTFFDGISQVGEYRFYRYKDDKLTEIGKISLYDKKFTTVYCGFTSGDKPCILTLWDNKVITADTEKVSIISESEIKG